MIKRKCKYNISECFLIFPDFLESSEIFATLVKSSKSFQIIRRGKRAILKSEDRLKKMGDVDTNEYALTAQIYSTIGWH